MGISIVLSPLLSAIMATVLFSIMKHVFSRSSNRGVLLTAATVFFIFFTTAISIFQIFLKGKISKVLLISVVTSILGSLIVMALVKRRMSRKNWRENALAFLLIVSLSFSAFAFGANDLANATGVFVTRTEILAGKPTLTTMLILSVLGSVFIALGGFTWGTKGNRNGRLQDHKTRSPNRILCRILKRLVRFSFHHRASVDNRFRHTDFHNSQQHR